jgi:phosphohistidine phosphatase SixA
MKQLFLLRHADYYGGGPDPALSEHGKEQSRSLGQRINKALAEGDVTIWTSPAKRASETAEIIKQELQLADVVTKDLLWSDNSHRHDFDWLKSELGSFPGEILIIISHLEYVRQFPETIGYEWNRAGYAQGVLISDGSCKRFGVL